MNEMHNIRANIPLFETFPLVLRQVIRKTKKVTKLSLRHSA